MKKFKIILFKKYLIFLGKLPRILAKNSFLTFWVLLVFALIIGAFLFYKYAFLIKKIEPQIIEKHFDFNKKNYEDVLKIWQEKEKKFSEIELKIYPNPFKID